MSNHEMPRVAVIIVNWNGKHYLDTCLSSLLQQTYGNFEAFVVDNGSADGSCDFIEQAYPRVRLIKLSHNTGFAQGNNIGIREAFKDKDVKYIALLNNDTRVDAPWLREMVQAAEADENLGMCSSKILLGETNVLHNIANYITRDGSGGSLFFGNTDAERYSQDREVFCPCGAAALYKRDMLERVGLFDEDYFSYYEDLDLGWRGRLNGWKCMYVAGAVVHHYHSRTHGAASPMKAYYIERNRLWFMLKNYPAQHVIASIPCSIVRYIRMAQYAWQGVDSAGKLARDTSGRTLVAITLRAYADALSKAGKMIAKRREVQNLQRVPEKEIGRWFREFGNWQ
jgi:hypothetical protein